MTFPHTLPTFTLWIVVPGSSTDISEDWEKDFDLDMTEEEVQMVLSKVDASGEVSGPGWPQALSPVSPGSEDSPHQAQFSPQGGSLLFSEVVGYGKEVRISHSGPK